MKEIIKDTDFAEISYDRELVLGKIEWKRKTSTEEYQFAFVTLLDFAKKNLSDNFLSDISRQSVVSPENRKWFETEMLPKAIEVGLKRVAVVFDGNFHYVVCLLLLKFNSQVNQCAFLTGS